MATIVQCFTNDFLHVQHGTLPHHAIQQKLPQSLPPSSQQLPQSQPPSQSQSSQRKAGNRRNTMQLNANSGMSMSRCSVSVSAPQHTLITRHSTTNNAYMQRMVSVIDFIFFSICQ